MRSATSSRRPLPAFALACVVSLGLAGGCGRGASRPSVLLVTLDTLRADHVGAYGAPPDATPHLDALARAGLVHEAAFTTMPTTAPAHFSLFTGLAPHEHGCEANGEPMRVALEPHTLPARLRRAGYATAAFVTSPLLDRSLTGLPGFEIYDDPKGVLRPGADAVEAALRWLDAEPRRPIFLWVHLYDAHAPYGTADDKRRQLPLPQGAYGWIDPTRYADPEARRQRAEAYAVGVREVDAALGRLVDGVRARLERPPLVIAVADHGETLGEHLEERGWGWDHGEFLDPEALRVPLVLSGPGVVGGRSPAPVSIRDLYTTVLAAAGIGDPDAAARNRRDLRTPSAAPRIVTAERRRERGVEDGEPDRAALAAVASHAAAATDGHTLVVVGEDGKPSSGGPSPPAALLATARATLAAQAATLGEPAPALDTATEAMLRSLGYAR